MEQFETCVCTVMSFLKEEEFSASVISQHKLCYQDLQEYLIATGLKYSQDIGYQWVELHHNEWNYRKYTGYRHCIDQLNDVLLTGEISLEHLSPRASAYSLLTNEYKSILDSFIRDTNCNDNRYRIACSRFLMYLQKCGIYNISILTYEDIISFHKNDYHRVQKSKDTYEDLIRVFLRYLSSIKKCDIGLSLALNKLLIDKIIVVSEETLHDIQEVNDNSYAIAWLQVTDFISELKSVRYGKTVIKFSTKSTSASISIQQITFITNFMSAIFALIAIIISLISEEGNAYIVYMMANSKFILFIIGVALALVIAWMLRKILDKTISFVKKTIRFWVDS